MRIAPDGRTAVGIAGLLALGSLTVSGLLAAFFVVVLGVLLWFYRDPERVPPEGVDTWVVPADGKVVEVENVVLPDLGKMRKVGIFMSPLDVHVNRFPIGGSSTFLGYFPGKRLFTFDEKSSDFNQHNAVLVRGEGTTCLIRQIVGPVCRRVVYWLRPDKMEVVQRGEKFGMMKFGSRLDMYFPKGDIEIVANIGDQVSAGQTVIARIVKKENQ